MKMVNAVNRIDGVVSRPHYLSERTIGENDFAYPVSSPILPSSVGRPRSGNPSATSRCKVRNTRVLSRCE
jgi:hypothetical protein